MSDKKTSSARFNASINNFCGVGGAKPKNGVGSSQIVNFRIDKNGALEKRCGFSRITSLDDDIDRVWYGKLFGKDRMIIISDSAIYEYTDSTLREIGRIDGLCDGEFSTFFYDDCLYFINSVGIYRLDENGLSTPICYAPLIGKDWPSGWIGPINEKKNLLSDYVRISYLVNESPVRYLRFTERVDRVVSLYRNGSLLSEEEYQLDNDNLAIHLSNLEEGDRFELTVKYIDATDAISSDARSTAQCTLSGGIEQKRPCFWGSDKGDSIYVCKQLSVDQKNDVKKHLACVPIYVTEDDIIKIGTGNHRVMAITKHFGRTIIFTENDAWRATEDGEAALNSDDPSVPISAISPIRINTSIGAYVVNGVTLAGNDPISIGRYSLFRWTSNTDTLDEQNALPISSDIDRFISDSFRKRSSLFFDRKRNEIYLYSDLIGEKIWVYQCSSEKWTSFDGFLPNQFFEYNGEAAFTCGNEIYVFNEALDTDVDGKHICASFLSDPIDFGSFEEKHTVALNSSVDGAVDFEIFYDGKNTPHTAFETKAADKIFSKRLSGKRFKYAVLKLTADGDTRQRIRSVTLKAR